MTPLLVAVIAIALAFTIPVLLPAASAQILDTTTTTTNGANGNTTSTATTTDQDGRRLSVLGALGISLVRDVEVTSTGIDKQQREVTVMLSSDTLSTVSTPAVTVAAFQGQLDLIGLLQQHMMLHGAGMTMGTTTTATQQGAMGSMIMSPSSTTAGMQGNYSRGGMGMFDIESFIDTLQIGSTTMPAGWTPDEPITIPVIDNVSNATTATIPSSTATTGGDTEILLVLVLPNTSAETQGALTTDETLIPPVE